MIKISFSGCTGTGKTSILNESKKILSLKEEVESIEYLSQKNPFDTDNKLNFVGQFYSLTNQINEENLKALTSPDLLLCDTSILDQWIRYKKYISDVETNNHSEEKNNLLKNLYHFWIRTYDIIFFIRVDPKILENRKDTKKLELPSLDYFKETESFYLQTIKDDNLKVIEIWNNNSVDESAHDIIKHISEFQQS
ncbi:MAG: AAA family ATPase [Candidatus Aminicenantes bacterium]|nr:AAA family ATPase [Candidatus Aminicenantes bacterium]